VRDGTASRGCSLRRSRRRRRSPVRDSGSYRGREGRCRGRGRLSCPSRRASSSPRCTHRRRGWLTRSAPRTWRQWQPPKGTSRRGSCRDSRYGSRCSASSYSADHSSHRDPDTVVLPVKAPPASDPPMAPAIPEAVVRLATARRGSGHSTACNRRGAEARGCHAMSGGPAYDRSYDCSDSKDQQCELARKRKRRSPRWPGGWGPKVGTLGDPRWGEGVREMARLLT
jgi:hypothetical protein